MDVVKHYLTYVVLIALFYATVVTVPKCSRERVPPDYTDIEGIEPYHSYRVDESVPLRALAVGDGICYRIGEDRDQGRCFGWIAALPGDQVGLVDGEVVVNGKSFPRAAKVQVPNAAPITVPDNHFYVVTSNHQTDSVALGPLPAISYRGRIGDLP
jgi:hypothetical protein